jgi:eukaryotic-like serine/threonine-protein kinase
MSQAQAHLTPLPIGTSITPGSLRAEMEARRASGGRFTIKDALAIVVPLCTQLAQLHGQGKRLYVHPSTLRYSPYEGANVVEELAHTQPTLPRDRACLAPEERRGAEGDARSSVFTIGAILYELLTNASVGPGMRRPSELVPELPPTLEALLGKALVADANHRPADLGALAQALHNIAPNASMAPPAADESRLDIEVDIRLSMMPPADMEMPASLPRPPNAPRIQQVQGDGLYAVAIPQAPVSRSNPNDPTQRLSDMKAALESDPRPRYVVVKDGMDHGPFSAVELLQQIASGSFLGAHALRDAFTNDERFIKDWEEFAPFAEQALLNREIVQEKKAFEAVVVAERKGTQYKALIGLAVVGVIAAMGAGLWFRERANKQAELEVHTDRVGSIEADAGLLPGAQAGGPGGALGGGPRPAGGGNYPVVSGGGSCEAAVARYSEEYKIGGGTGAPDLTAGAYGNVLNRGSYLNACGVPGNMSVNICAAVQNGRAVGVSVSTTPHNPGIAGCVAQQVRGLPFPSHPRLDVARTTFAAN